MIRKNPRGDLPVVHESAFVDPTAAPLVGQADSAARQPRAPPPLGFEDEKKTH